MKALVIKPKNENELKFISGLLKKLGIDAAKVSSEDLEDIQMSKLMRNIDRSKKVSRSQVMKKLTS